MKRSIGQDKEFKDILESVMECEVPKETHDIQSIDYLVIEGYLEEHGNRKFHVTQWGALLYSEIFLRLANPHNKEEGTK